MGTEALAIYEQLDHISGQANSLQQLASLFYDDYQLDAAEEAASRTIDLSAEGNQFPVCESHRILGKVYRSKGETEKAIDHFETADRIGSSFDWHDRLFWIQYDLVVLFIDSGRFDDAHRSIERAKSYSINDPYQLGRAINQQAWVWYRQHRFKEAKSEALRAIDVYERLGATRDLESCRGLLQWIEEGMKKMDTSGG